MDERTVEPVPEIAAAGAGTVFVVGPEHDVVGEKLRAAVEQLREALLAVLGVELVLLLDRHPRELEPLVLDLFVSARVLGLEPRKLVSGGLPFLAGSDRVLRHLPNLLSAVSGRASPPAIRQHSGQKRDPGPTANSSRTMQPACSKRPASARNRRSARRAGDPNRPAAVHAPRPRRTSAAAGARRP